MRSRGMILLLALAPVVTVSACDRGGDSSETQGEMSGMEGMERMEGMEDMQGTQVEDGMMERHADEAERMAGEMRRHVEQMRQRAPAEWHDRMGEHVEQVSGMLSLMNRQMREMDMGMGMSDEEMGRMMGMSAEEHRAMREEMEALRGSMEQLQTAPRADVEERMPDHLDRVERMAEMLEESASHMRAM